LAARRVNQRLLERRTGVSTPLALIDRAPAGAVGML
jgi:hypothetical protein